MCDGNCKCKCNGNDLGSVILASNVLIEFDRTSMFTLGTALNHLLLAEGYLGTSEYALFIETQEMTSVCSDYSINEELYVDIVENIDIDSVIESYAILLNVCGEFYALLKFNQFIKSV